MRNSQIILVPFLTFCFRFVSVIAKPMASKKLAKKVYKVHNQFDQKGGHWCHTFLSYQKVIKKGSKHKGFVRNGLKDVQVRSHILLFFIGDTGCFF